MGNMFRCTFASGGVLILTVTCDSAFAGQTITCTDGTTTLTQICPSTSPYSVEFRIPNGGTWTISSGTVSTSVVIPDSIELHDTPDGSTVTPTDDIQIWLHCANIWDKSYTTITQVLNDTSTLQALIASNNAVDYMVRSTTWASDVVADSSAMSYIGLNDYCADSLLADSTWVTAICNSAYFESVLNVKVPTMTSDTAPSGRVIYSGQQSGQRGYHAFDKNTNTMWVSSSPASSGAYIGYIFETEVNIKKMVATQGHNRNLTTKFQASQDGSTWIDLSEEFTIPTGNYQTVTSIKEDNTKYTRYRYYIVALRSDGTTYGAEADEVQFYGRA